MTLKLVVFDCDGVLVETESITTQILVDNLGKYGLIVKPDEVHDLFVGGTMMSAGAEATRRGATLPEHWLAEVSAAVNAELAKGVVVFDGLFDLLNTLDANGIKTAIASNGPMDKMATSLGPSGLFDRFEGRIYSGREMKPKPAPDMLIAAMTQANASPSQTVMIDDTPVGIKSADAAGTRAIGFAAASNADALRATGHPVAMTMADVQRLLRL